MSATAAAKLPSNNDRIVKKQNTHLDSSYIKFILEPFTHVVLLIFSLSCQQVGWWSGLGTIWNAPYVLQWVSLEFIWGVTWPPTLEDILEEIVGDITDEFDDENIFYSKLDENNYVFEGKTPLVDLYKILEMDGESWEEAKGESDTLAGFILEQAGKIPLKNEKVKFENFTLTIEAADKRRIKRVKLTVGETEKEKSAK